MPNQLRPHQRTAVEAIRADLGRQQLIMACGTGKTLTGMYAVAKLLQGEPGTVLILVPTLTLLQQTFEAWAEHAPFAFDAIAVCSKLTASECRAIGTEEDLDTDQLSLTATTYSGELAAFLADSADTVRVVFGTYQSLGAVITAHADQGMAPWSVVVCDEAHRTAGKKTKPFARVLHDQHVPARRRLFLTATPKVHMVSEKETSPEKSALLASMDNEQLYGPPVYTLSVAEAVEKKILSEYQVAVIGIEDSELHAAAQVLDNVTVNGQQLSLDHVAAIVALSKSAQEHGLRSIIAFYNSIKASKAFVAAFNLVHAACTDEQLAEGTAEHIDGAMKLDTRREALDRLAKPREEGYRLVSNARCLSEGIDVPTLDAVLFGEPRASQIEVVQCVGRAIRKNGDRTALIILGVRVGDGDDVETAIEEQQFKKIRQVLAALEDHDPRIVEAARILSRAYTPSQGSPDRPRDDEVTWAEKLLALDVPERVLSGGFGLRILGDLDQRRDEGFRELQAFASENGHARVPNRYETDAGFNLGNWVALRRGEYRSGKLSTQRVTQLEAVPGWTWDARDYQWDEGLRELQAFASENGHARVPNRYETDAGFNLGNWVALRRGEYRSGKLSRERITQLETLPGWTWDARDDQWDEGFRELQAFASENGHARVLLRHLTAAGFNLGSWVARRRGEYRSGKLSRERITQLETLPGWTWDAHDDQWDEGFRELQAFASENGHARVLSRYDTAAGFRLGRWVARRRGEYRSGKLSRERITQLETLPGWAWNAPVKSRIAA
ncbi:Helicase associated domain protein [Mycolicibacterium porcinum]|uniref:DEAD/DEAH box helicase n=1 Tax=Mycolicibacterium porcinum TaxID=39693 RepID=UPI0031FA289D